MKTIYFFISALYVLSNLFAGKPVEFKNAVDNKYVKFDAYWDDDNRYLTLKLISNLPEDIVFKLNPGLTFYSSKYNVQPRVLATTRKVLLRKGEQRLIYLKTYCGNAPLASGKSITDLKFDRLTMQSQNLSQILSTLEEKNWTNKVSVQNIVWLFTNKLNIASALITSLTGKDKKEFEKFLTAKSGSVIPPHRLKYKDPEPGSDYAFSGEAEWISGEFSYTLKEVRNVHLKLYNSENELIRVVQSLPQQKVGTYKLPYLVALDGVKQGAYILALEGDSVLIHNQPFEI